MQQEKWDAGALCRIDASHVAKFEACWRVTPTQTLAGLPTSKVTRHADKLDQGQPLHASKLALALVFALTT